MQGANGKGFCASFLADKCGPPVFAVVTNRCYICMLLFIPLAS